MTPQHRPRPPRRTPQLMRVRAAVREALRSSSALCTAASTAAPTAAPLVLVGLSGGADSLALAAALAAEAPGCGVRAGAAIIDHGLQQGSAEVAARAAEQARRLGLSPVIVRRVSVQEDRASLTGGLEPAARTARYAALAEIARETGAACVLTAHTRDDQAEQVLLGLARGAGTRSLAGIPLEREIGAAIGEAAGVGAQAEASVDAEAALGTDAGLGTEAEPWRGRRVAVLRPLLAEPFDVHRATTEAACAELGLEPWQDPHNLDPAFARVRVRTRVLPLLEAELGPGVARALARSADQAREDADALDALAEQALGEILLPHRAGHGGTADGEATVLAAKPLAELPAALRNRVIRAVARGRFGSHLSREHTLALAALATAWRGQGPIQAPGFTATRKQGMIVLRPHPART